VMSLSLHVVLNFLPQYWFLFCYVLKSFFQIQTKMYKVIYCFYGPAFFCPISRISDFRIIVFIFIFIFWFTAGFFVFLFRNTSNKLSNLP
jgi:hypothetical protein